MKKSNRITLEQINAIACNIKERYPYDDISMDLVAIECGELFEDIAGMESISITAMQELTHYVWSNLSEK
ncbi:hypothetical protein ACJJID_19430 [Microbulbifer sp. CnH-101-G]|uniref:hypothetical protein n=1 Tax=Microbulbifer sp. CnH-101-G TaxID=3243393 RepID=UPI0040396E2A